MLGLPNRMAGIVLSPLSDPSPPASSVELPEVEEILTKAIAGVHQPESLVLTTYLKLSSVVT